MIKLMNNADDEHAWISDQERKFLTDKYHEAYYRHKETYKLHMQATKELYAAYEELMKFYENQRE